MDYKVVYQYDYKGYYINELLLNKTDKSPSGAWNIPSHCTEIEPPESKEGYLIKWNGFSWEMEEIPKEDEIKEPKLSEEEKVQQSAEQKKYNLKNMAISAMMMSLAGNDITPFKLDYQEELNAISDEEALYIPDVFPQWNSNSVEYKVGDKVLYNNILYKVITAHTSQEGWTPTSAPSLFAKMLTSEGEILEWEQPSSTNPYMKGDKVRYNGKIYESVIDNNVWSPEAYPQGWKEVEE